MIDAIAKYAFMQNAIMAAVLASLISGVIGTIIVEKKMASLAGGLAHASFGGVGIGYYLGIEPIYGAFVFSTLSSLGIKWFSSKTSGDHNTISGMMWAGGMAIGIFAIWISPGYPPDMSSYLFGDILAVDRDYLYLMAGLTLIILVSVISVFKYLRLYLFDENYAKIIHINTKILDFGLYTAVALSVVMLIKVVGIVLSIAMLSIPAASAKFFTKSLSRRMLAASAISMINTVFGLSLSYYLNVPSGAVIVIISILIYAIIIAANKFAGAIRRK